MQCSQTFSSVTTNGIDIFLLENPDYFPFFSYNIFGRRFFAQFIYSSIDFQTNVSLTLIAAFFGLNNIP